MVSANQKQRTYKLHLASTEKQVITALNKQMQVPNNKPETGKGGPHLGEFLKKGIDLKKKQYVQTLFILQIRTD